MASLEQEIYDKLISEYPHGLVPITDLSYNDSDANKFVVSPEIGFNFDLLYNLSTAYKAPHKERTPDALFCVNDKLHFVEFKEGADKKPDIRLKIHEGIVSLYMFVSKHLPHITKDKFVDLSINYSVLVRAPSCTSEVSRRLRRASDMHQLKNIEGFLVRKTSYTVCPKMTAEMLGRLTSGKVKSIEIYERSGAVNTYSAT